MKNRKLRDEAKEESDLGVILVAEIFKEIFFRLTCGLLHCSIALYPGYPPLDSALKMGLKNMINMRIQRSYHSYPHGDYSAYKNTQVLSSAEETKQETMTEKFITMRIR